MLIYLFKASCCLAAFILFYRVLLEGQKMHQIKRVLLLLVLIISACIPAITITFYVDSLPTRLTPTEIVWDEYVVLENGIELLPTLSWSIYGIGFVFFGYRFLRNILALRSKIRQSELHQFGDYTLALLDTPCIPHSFFNYIFLNKSQYESGQIPRSVIDHEIAHASQRHSIDVLTVELVNWFMWFNPVIYLLKRDIRLNHEFLADEAVVKMGHPEKEYQKTLLGFSSNSNPNPFIHFIHYQPLKKRFKIMKKQTSMYGNLIRLLSIIPLIASLTLGFSSKAIAQKTAKSNKTEQGASKKMILEYNKIARYYNEESDKAKKVSLSDVKRLKELYSKMTDEQRKTAEPFPNFPPPPPAPKVKKGDASSIPPPPPPPVNIEDMDQGQIIYYRDGKKITTEQAVAYSKTEVPLKMKVKKLDPETNDGKTLEVHLIQASEEVVVKYFLGTKEITEKEAKELAKTQTPTISRARVPESSSSTGSELYELRIFKKAE